MALFPVIFELGWIEFASICAFAACVIYKATNKPLGVKTCTANPRLIDDGFVKFLITDVFSKFYFFVTTRAQLLFLNFYSMSS